MWSIFTLTYETYVMPTVSGTGEWQSAFGYNQRGKEQMKGWSHITGEPFEKTSSLSSDQVRNSYYIGADGSLRLMLANGMEVALQTEPHLLAGTVNPTVGKRNVTLPIDNGLNLVEWRQRKEQARGQVTVFGRRLRVSEKHEQFWTPLPILPVPSLMTERDRAYLYCL